MRTLRIFSSLLFTLVLSAFACGGAVAAVQIRIDKSAQRMVVSVDGAERYSWPVSTGRLGHDTPSGSFRTFRMEKDHFSKEWDDAPMPHSIFFTKKGHAIHGSFHVKQIGSPASAGCVRLAPANAAKLFALVEKEGVLNTTVSITGDVHVALARGKHRTASARGGDEPHPAQHRPRTLTPNESSGGGTASGRHRDARQGGEYADAEELDAYAARMRRRYYQERPQPRYAQPYYDRPYYYDHDDGYYSGRGFSWQ